MEPGTVVLNLDRLRRSCTMCVLRELCLRAGVDGADLERLNTIIHDKHLLDRGKTLFLQGDRFRALYVVRSGSLKTFVENHAGDVQVLGFHLPGEIVGMDALAGDRHLCSSEALERTSICELPYAQLQRVAGEIPALLQQLVRVISREVGADQDHLVMMGARQAQERLAIFLRNFTERCERLSRDPLNFSLPMSRHDLANYLGLAMETVSRLFGKMEADGVIAVDRKKVRILRPELLAGSRGGDQLMIRSRVAD